MKREDISRAVGDIDTEYIEEAADEEPHRKHGAPWKWALTAAACVALVLTAALYQTDRRPMSQGSGENASAGAAADCSESQPELDSDGDETCAPESAAPDTEKGALPEFNDAILHPAVGSTIQLLADDFVPLSQEELLTYFQTELPISDILPELYPFAQEDTPPSGVYRSGGGRGETYYDRSRFSYANLEGSQQLQILLSRVSHGQNVQPQLLTDGRLRFTPVNGRRLAVFRDGDTLYVEWMQHDVGWRVRADGLPGETFYQLLTQLVEPAELTEQQSLTGQLRVIDPQAHTVAVQPEQGRGVQVRLPQDFAMDQLHLYDRVTVTWQGECASLGAVWTEQLLEFTPQKGA